MFVCSAFRYLIRLVLAEHLHERRDRRVGGAGRIRIGHLDLALRIRA